MAPGLFIRNGYILHFLGPPAEFSEGTIEIGEEKMQVYLASSLKLGIIFTKHVLYMVTFGTK